MMERLQTLLGRLRSWLQSLTQQQRMLFLVVFMGAVYFVWSSIWEDYYLSNKSVIDTQVKDLNEKVQTIAVTRQKIKNLEKDPRTMETKKKLIEVRQQIQAISRQLVTSKQMLDQLKGVFATSPDIQFSRVQNVGVVPFSLESAGQEPDKKNTSTEAKKVAGSPFYQHNFLLTFEASYFATQRYLEQLQKLPGQLYFDNINYEVTKYPVAMVILKVHTISPDEGLIDA